MLNLGGRGVCEHPESSVQNVVWCSLLDFSEEGSLSPQWQSKCLIHKCYSHNQYLAHQQTHQCLLIERMNMLSENERSYTVCMFLCLVYIGCRSCCFHYLHVFFWKATVEISFCLNHRNRCAASVWLFASCFTDSVNPLRCMNPEKVWSLALWPSLSKRWSCILHANKTLNFIYFFCLHFFFNWSYLLHYFFKLYFFLVGFDQLLDFFSIIW